MAYFRDIRVNSYFPRCWTIEWDLADHQDGLITIDIERSESPEGPWEPVASDLENATLYHDWQVSTTNPFRQFWYQLAGHDGPKLFVSDPATCIRIPTGRTRHIVKMHDRLLQARSGTPVYFFIRRTWGRPCPACTIMGTSQSAFCKACYGTGIAEGYWDPILGWVAQTAKYLNNLVIPGEVIQENMKAFWTSNYPGLHVDDIFIDAVDGRVWKIAGPVHQIVPEANIVRQNFKAIELPRNDVLYNLTIPKHYKMIAKGYGHRWVEVEIPASP